MNKSWETKKIENKPRLKIFYLNLSLTCNVLFTYNFVQIKNQPSKIEVEIVKDRVLFFTYSFTYW